MRQLLCCFVVSILILVGCSQQEQKKEEPTAVPVKKQSAELKLSEFTENAWLRGSLPEEAVAYFRLPTPWFLFVGIESGFNYAQKNEQYVKQLEAIQEGLYNNIISQLEPTLKPIASMLFKHMDSPLEVGVLMNTDDPMASPMVLATKLDFETIDSFYQNLSELLAVDEAFQENDTVDSKGYGGFSVPAAGFNSVYRFDPQTKKLLIVTGRTDKAGLHTILDGIKPTASHPMHAIENKIDASAKGLFGYIKVKSIIPIVQTMLPPETQFGLKMSGFDQVNALAFGYGASEGKTRLKVVVDIPNVGFRAYLPSVNNTLDFSARGSIDSLGVLALPTEPQFRQVEGLIMATSQPVPEYTLFKQSFKEETGFDVKQIFSIIGPEVAYFADEINDFLAIKLKNPEQFSQLIKNLSDKGFIEYNEYKRENFTIKNITLPFTPDNGLGQMTEMLKNDPAIAGNMKVLLNMVEKLKGHYYWVEEDGFIILANIPQPLIERNLRDDKVSVKNWLANSQKHDMSSSLVAFSTSKKDISRDYYYHYLQLLQSLVDISGAQIDFLSLPHAGELKFAEKGSVGFSLDSNENYLALEFNFEESLVDLFYAAGGTYETVAVIGVLAAVAIPQFEAYRGKAQTQAVLYSATVVKQGVEEQLSQGVPLSEIANGNGNILAPTDYADQYIDSIDVNNGVVTVTLDAAANQMATVTDPIIVFTPVVNQSTGSIDWECSSEGVSVRHLPPMCKSIDQN